MKKVLSILLILALTFTLVSCTQEKEPESEKKEKLLLGLSFASLDALYFQAQKERAEKAATELGFDIVIAVADNDSNKQLQQCEDMLTQKVDALLVVPVDKVAIVSVVDACVEKQIPYIAVGRMPEDMTNVAFAAKGDNIDRAWESAKLIRKIADDMGKTGTIKVIEMIGNLTDQAAVERHQGFVEASVKYNLEIVGEVNTEWDTEKAYNRFN
ncbi:MAG: sugar ABC transporter substrate-binding protein, partial [Oscillospiraceae bacterium]